MRSVVLLSPYLTVMICEVETNEFDDVIESEEVWHARLDQKPFDRHKERLRRFGWNSLLWQHWCGAK